MQSSPSPTARPDRGLLPFGLAIAANAIVAGMSLQFYSAPTGSSIRPMGWAAFCGMVALVSFSIVIPAAITSMRQSHHYALPVLAIVLSLLPFPLACVILNHATAVKGLVLSP